MTALDTIKNWTDSTMLDIKKNYNRMGLKASGQFEKLLDSEIDVTAKGWVINFKGASYTEYLENGRRATRSTTPGSPPLRDLIRQWIDDKGITPREKKMSKDTLAFLITRKIHSDGIKVPNTYNTGGVVSDVIKNNTPELIKELTKAYIIDIQSELIKAFKDGSNGN